MLASGEMIAFIPASTLEEARRFYAEVLGLRLVTKDALASVFDANGAMGRVTKAGKFTPAPFTVPGRRVDDIKASVDQLVAKGVVPERDEGMVQDDLGVWASPSGAKVAWFRDLDGNTLSLTEF